MGRETGPKMASSPYENMSDAELDQKIEEAQQEIKNPVGMTSEATDVFEDMLRKLQSEKERRSGETMDKAA